jgi:hypothetical protein
MSCSAREASWMLADVGTRQAQVEQRLLVERGREQGGGFGVGRGHGDSCGDDVRLDFGWR